MSRTKGAKDKKRRRRRRGRVEKISKLKQVESGSRSIANLGRGLNSLSNSVREARITAKYFGINPAARNLIPVKVGLLQRIRGAREGVDLVNATARGGFNIRRLLPSKPRGATHAYIHHIKHIGI
jgi:hypothetical protein